MTDFASAIQTPPPVFDSAAAKETLGVCEPPAGAPSALLAAAAGGAPFLGRTARREAEWLAGVWTRPLSASWTEILDAARAAAASERSEAEAMRALRVARRRAALLAALADLGGAWDLDTLTGALTTFADTALGAVLERLIEEEARRGKLASLDPARSGVFALAMGKMGAGELNYSSDIDLILLYDPNRLAASDRMTAKERWPRLARGVLKLMSEVTNDGYVARVDLRLRPDPGATPAVMSTEAAELYYEALGRTWERAAHIKARVAAGDVEAGRAYLQDLTPFIWRRHLDFAAMEETSGILAKIRAAEGGAEIAVRGQDVKLGAGGIREIEFIAQTQQLMLGGRDPSLRTPGTRATLKALVAAERLEEPTRQRLDAAYVHLRRLEHRLQMIEDRQTHRVPTEAQDCARVAALMNAPDFETLEAETRPMMMAVRAASSFLDPRPTGADARSGLSEAYAALPDPAGAQRLVEGWLMGRYRALRTERARAKLERMAPELLRRMAAASDPMGALMRFDRFVASLPAGVQLFSLFEETPALLDLVTEITAVAPRLADILARRSRVFDAVLDPDFFDAPPAEPALRADLEATLRAPGDDYEYALDETRRWAAERRFQVGVGLLRGVLAPETASAAFADVADACLRALYPHVEAELRRRYGAPPGGGAAVLAMGNFGSREMTATSDIDLITVYDAELGDQSDGPRPQTAPQYYARFTQTLTSAFTAPTSEGVLYDVDMRLRPSGNAGPLATSLAAFTRYQREDAWVWEHMALTRARPVAGPEAAQTAARAAIAEALGQPREAEAVLNAAREMRERLDQAHAADRDRLWALKHGHGGMMDAEFIAQAGVLAAGVAGEGGLSTRAAFERLAEVGFLEAAETRALTEAHGVVMAAHQMRRLAMEAPFDMENAGDGARRVLARVIQAADFDMLEIRLAQAKQTVRAVFERRIGGVQA